MNGAAASTSASTRRREARTRVQGERGHGRDALRLVVGDEAEPPVIGERQPAGGGHRRLTVEHAQRGEHRLVVVRIRRSYDDGIRGERRDVADLDPVLHVQVRGHGPADRVHAARADVAREAVRLRSEAAAPLAHDPVARPAVHERLEHRCPHREELRAGVEHRAREAFRRHAPARPRRPLEHGDINALVDEPACAHQPGDARADNDHAHRRRPYRLAPARPARQG